MQFYLLSKFLPEICWEGIAEKILFVYLFLCLAWGSNPGFTSYKPTHCLLDYGILRCHNEYSTMVRKNFYNWYKLFTEYREDENDDDSPGWASVLITDENEIRLAWASFRNSCRMPVFIGHFNPEFVKSIAQNKIFYCR